VKTEYFLFGGLDLLAAERRLDGMLTLIRTPSVVGVGASSAMISDLKRIAYAISMPGRSPSPVVCFVPSGATVEADVRDPDGLADAFETVRGFLDLPPSVLRMAVLDEEPSAFAPLAFAQHVVFARSGAVWSGELLRYPNLKELCWRRTSDFEGATRILSAEGLQFSGMVDEIFEGEPSEAAAAYVEAHERRRNGETGLYEAMRSARPSYPVDFRPAAASWLTEMSTAA
jgi:hypothetical protein